MVTKKKAASVISGRPVVDPVRIGSAIELVFGRWTAHVLCTLARAGRLRFTELQALLPAISPKVLTERLRRLERDGFIERSYHREIPPRVEYQVTPLALTLLPVFSALADWADAYLDQVTAAQRRHDDARPGP